MATSALAPPARPTPDAGRGKLRPRHVTDGRETAPYVGRVDRDGVHIYNHRSKGHITVDWRALFAAAADAAGASIEEVIEFHLTALRESLSGHSAPSAGAAGEGAPDGQNRRRA